MVGVTIFAFGSFLGGFLGRALSIYREGEPAGFVMSLLGAIVVVVAYHAIANRRSLA